MSSYGDGGWLPWRVIPRLVGGVIAIPVVAGFVALGATVLVARSLRGLARETWLRLPSRRGSPVALPPRSDSHAA